MNTIYKKTRPVTGDGFGVAITRRVLCGGSIAAVCFLSALPPAARAAIIAYDSFNSYTANSTLNGDNGGTGWSGAWSSNSSVIVESPTTALSYAGGAVAVNGGANAVQIPDVNGDGIISREFSSQSGALYFSFLYREDARAGTATNFLQFALNNDAAINGSGAIVASEAVGEFGVRLTNLTGTQTTGNSATPTIDVGTTYFVVAKLYKSASNYDRMSLFVNPTSLTEPGTPSATSITDIGISSVSFFSVRTANLAAGDQTLFDELRVGTSFADVVIPEPTTWALLATGLATTVILRRRRQA